MKKIKSLRMKLIVTTSLIMMLFLSIFALIIFIMLSYYGQIMIQVYDIDEHVMVPIGSILIIAFLILIVIALLGSFLGGYIISNQMLRSISQLHKQIGKVREEGIEERIEITSRDEFSLLANEFNEMMDEVEENMKGQVQFVSDASHELRTPLAILKNNLEMLERWGKEDPAILDKALKTCGIETNRMIHLVEQLLQLSRKEFYEKEIIAFAPQEELEMIIDNARDLYPMMNFMLHIQEPYDIYMDKEHFEQLVFIFIDNAVKYKKETSNTVEISYDKNILKIKDNGIGIKEENKELLFQRFFKEDTSRKSKKHSFGLGLSIAKRMSEYYDFTIAVDSVEQEYSEFTITFGRKL